jgi:hypothetical protein
MKEKLKRLEKPDSFNFLDFTHFAVSLLGIIRLLRMTAAKGLKGQVAL